VTNRTTHENRPEEDPSQVGASCLVEGKVDHQDQEASSREEGNRDQEGKEDELCKVVRGWVAKIQDCVLCLRPPNPGGGGGPPNPPGGGPMPMGGPFMDGGGPRC